jgi:hypothetical protein
MPDPAELWCGGAGHFRPLSVSFVTALESGRSVVGGTDAATTAFDRPFTIPSISASPRPRMASGGSRVNCAQSLIALPPTYSTVDAADAGRYWTNVHCRAGSVSSEQRLLLVSRALRS